MGEYRVAPLERLIEQFERFPSVGHKTASRLAYHVLSMTEEDINSFSQTVIQAHKNIRHCKICCNLTDTEICSVCSDESRDKRISEMSSPSKEQENFMQLIMFSTVYSPR